MAKVKEISRRQFVASALTTATLASLPIDHLFADAMPNQSASAAAPTSAPSLERSGYRESHQITARQASEYSCTRGHHQKRFLGSAARD